MYDALYIPNSTVRLISVSALSITCGTGAYFDDEHVKIVNKSTGAFIAGGPLIPSKRLYCLNIQSAYAEHALSAQHSPTIETWHRRLGHVNYQAITEMARNGMIAGMPSAFSSKPPKCESCILGKQTKTPVPKKREEGPGHRSQRKLGIVWVDLTGPEDVAARSGHKYIMNLVDDHTSFVWTILLKLKSDALPELKAWELARESETGLKVGIYRTGHDGELNSDAMRAWLASRGVQQEFGAAYTSEHIGRVERMHRTLMGKARSMRIAAKCPPNMWGEFYLTASHLHAKTLTSSLKGKTPWELYYGRKPDYSYMREIGCRAFVLILNKHNPKIYERSIECILIGYDPKAKTYRCYDRRSGNIYSSYHVRFLESHDGHPPPPINQPTIPERTQPSNLEQIIRTSVMEPLTMDDEPATVYTDDNEGSHPDVHIELPPEPISVNPHPDEPRRSSRAKVPTTKGSPDNPPQTRTEKAVQESMESAARVKAARIERRQAVQNLHEEGGEDPIPAEQAALAELRDLFRGLDLGEIGENIDHDRIFSAITEAGSIDPSLLEFDDEPKTWNEAKESSDAKLWENGYREELNSLKEMGVYKLIPRPDVPQGKKVNKGKPVFKIKRDEVGKAVRHKVRLVFKGFEQIYGRDYTKTTSPTARMESWRILLHLAASLGWDAAQIDIKTAFLYGLLPEEETQYMEQPKDFEEPGKEDWVELQRGLYGMKQSGRIWNQTMNENMIKWNFTRLSCESCIYYRKSTTGIVIAAVHVDDFLSIASNKEENEIFKEQMRKVWQISDLGLPKFVVGIAVDWDRENKTVKLSQTALIDKIVQQFGQTDAAPLSVPMDPGLKLRRVDLKALSADEQATLAKLPYRSLVGCLLYLAIATRPDIAYSVQQFSQFLDCFSFVHWNAAIRLVRYLKGTRDLKLHLGGPNIIDLVGFTDSDWANCPDTRRSIGGYIWTLGYGALSWCARKQKPVAASSCEAEYMAAFEATKECIWLRALLLAIGFLKPGPTKLLCDNNAAINLSEDPLLHTRVKHVDIKYHFLRERVQSKELELRYINTNDNVADLFTKALDHKKFIRLRTLLGLL